MRLAALFVLLPAVALAQSAATAGRFVTLRISGSGTFGSTVTATGFAGSSTTSTTLTTATAATVGNDYGLIVNNTATLTGDSNHTDRLVSLRNNGAAVHEFYASGRYRVAAAVNNGSPGFRFDTPSGGSATFRLSGGNGESVQLFGENTVVSSFYLGDCPATNCAVYLGPSAFGTAEVIIYKGTNGPAVKMNVKQNFDSTDNSGSPGATTISKPAGKAAIAAGASSVVVTSTLVTAASMVFPVIQTNDSTCNGIDSVVPAAGSFTINLNANCTAATTVAFVVHN